MNKKNNLLVFALVVIGIVLVIASSCKKDDKKEDNNVIPVSTNTLTATIDGNSYVASYFMRQNADGEITILTRNSVQTMVIGLQDTLKVGTYPLQGVFDNCYIEWMPTIGDVYTSKSGSINFTEFSKTGKIKGTFNCVVSVSSKKSTTINITNGVIEVNY